MLIHCETCLALETKIKAVIMIFNYNFMTVTINAKYTPTFEVHKYFFIR